MAVVMPTTA